MGLNLDLLFNVIGTIGVICCLAAFYLVQSERTSPQQMIYPVLNLVGAILLLISLLWSWNTPSVLIEIAWISISVYGIYRIMKERKKNAEK